MRQKPSLYGLEHDIKALSVSVSHSFELPTRLFSLKACFCLSVCSVTPKRGIDLPSTSARVIRVRKIIAVNKLSS